MVVTMTTVGFGDVSPNTTIGKFLATCAMIFGVLFLSMPLAIVGAPFSSLFFSLSLHSPSVQVAVLNTCNKSTPNHPLNDHASTKFYTPSSPSSPPLSPLSPRSTFPPLRLSSQLNFTLPPLPPLPPALLSLLALISPLSVSRRRWERTSRRLGMRKSG